eukprot:875268-Karenia_brevis.AAC.1
MLLQQSGHHMQRHPCGRMQAAAENDLVMNGQLLQPVQRCEVQMDKRFQRVPVMHQIHKRFQRVL